MEGNDEHIIDLEGRHFIFKNCCERGQRVSNIDILERVVDNRLEHLHMNLNTGELNWRPV